MTYKEKLKALIELEIGTIIFIGDGQAMKIKGRPSIDLIFKCIEPFDGYSTLSRKEDSKRTVPVNIEYYMLFDGEKPEIIEKELDLVRFDLPSFINKIKRTNQSKMTYF